MPTQISPPAIGTPDWVATAVADYAENIGGWPTEGDPLVWLSCLAAEVDYLAPFGEEAHAFATGAAPFVATIEQWGDDPLRPVGRIYGIARAEAR